MRLFDYDDDNDGLLDTYEDSSSSNDIDGDGILNSKDLDSMDCYDVLAGILDQNDDGILGFKLLQYLHQEQWLVTVIIIYDGSNA